MESVRSIRSIEEVGIRYMNACEEVQLERQDAKAEGISARVLSEIHELARRHDISQVLLFGSRSRGDFRRTSDIDLAVSGGDVSGFALDVDEETDTLLFFDIVNLDGSVQDALRDSIRREGKVIYEKV